VRSFISIFIAVVVVLALGCSNTANVSNANTNQAKSNANMNANKIETAAIPAADAPVEGSLATPSDAYRTAYALREKKDVEGLKKVMSKDVLEFLTMMGEDEKKTLNDQISEIFIKPQAKTPEVRNEKISGDRASVEYLDEDGKWKTMDFVKEDGVWKMGLPGNDPDAEGKEQKK
jgi:hypothetical protein